MAELGPGHHLVGDGEGDQLALKLQEVGLETKEAAGVSQAEGNVDREGKVFVEMRGMMGGGRCGEILREGRGMLGWLLLYPS